MKPDSRITDSPDPDGKPQRPLTEAERKAMWREHWSWIRYIALSAADGMALGALIAVLIIRLNVHGIGEMLASSEHGTGYTAMLIIGFAHTFGMVVAGSAIWIRATGTRD